VTLARLLFAVVLVGVEALHVRNARQYMQQQLDAHAQQSATALALSLGTILRQPDRALAETIVNPVFDRGYYSRVRFQAPDGQVIVERLYAGPQDDTPAWFRRLLPLEPPQGEALVSSGWRQLGRVQVTVDPRIAYSQLWDLAFNTVMLLAGLYMAALLATRLLLTAILSPLSRVVEAAHAIARREFNEIPDRGGTRELRSVVQAMNALSGKVRDAIAQESVRVEQQLREAYEDPVSGQLNERGFAQRAETLIHGDGEVASGALALFVLRSLDDFNRARGQSAGDAMLRTLGEIAARDFDGRRPLVGRYRGAAFLALMPDVSRGEAEVWARRVIHEAALQHAAVTAGVVHFDATHPRHGELEACAGEALADARRRDADMAMLDFSAGTERARPVAEWGVAIDSALAESRTSLVAQDVVRLSDNAVLHREVMLRLVEKDGASIRASLFMPAATHLGRLPALDARVAQDVARALAARPLENTVIALNVSGQSLASPAYREALRRVFAEHRGIGKRLVFELSAYSAGIDPGATEEFARELRGHSAEFALDDLELSTGALMLVRRLLPAYVKLAPAYSKEMAEHASARFVVESLLSMLKPIDVALIVKGVESDSLLAALKATGVAGCQGYAVARPVPFPS
jgi:EAL domain-containing protein (putative c-di-GMP-specific phosphodiesterase class I)